MATIDNQHDFGGVLHEPIKYEPTEDDLRHIKEIEDFFEETGIPYEKDENFGIYHLNDKTLQVRYVNSSYHRMDNSTRYPHLPKGIIHSYFIDISHWNASHGIRTVWIYDHEMEQHNTAIIDGKVIENYRRMWNVICNSLATATQHIKHRIYARDCEARFISNAEARPFLEANCFYGYRSASPEGTVALFLKKDKCGLKAGTMLQIASMGMNFYGMKNKQDAPPIEIIRVSTLIGVQVVGGLSKSFKYMIENRPVLHSGGKEFKVDRIVFYVDASHNDGRGMTSSAMNFNFVSWAGEGFMNLYLEDVDDTDPVSGKHLVGKKGEVFHRKPMFHKQIMRLISEGKIVSVANAGTLVCDITRDEFLARFTK